MIMLRLVLLFCGLFTSLALDYCPSSNAPTPKPTALIQPNKPAPFFKGQALVGKEFKEISLTDYKGKYVFLLFYPLDFDRIEEFRSLGCEVIACSTDSVYSHLAWTKMSRKMGGLGEMKIPLLSDKTFAISRAYGVLDEDEGHAFRGLFLIDKQGILRQMTINDRPVGRSVNEALRLLKAFQFHEEHGDVCPVNWEPKSKTMKPDPVQSESYFASTY